MSWPPILTVNSDTIGGSIEERIHWGDTKLMRLESNPHKTLLPTQNLKVLSRNWIPYVGWAQILLLLCLSSELSPWKIIWLDNHDEKSFPNSLTFFCFI